MMRLLRSIKFQVWLRFEAIVMAMLLFIYIFLIASFPTFYEWMKTYEISEAVVTIKANWYSSNLDKIISQIARENKMYIELYNPYNGNAVRANGLGGSVAIVNISKEQYQEEVRSSETGMVYKRFRDEQEDNSLLMVCSYIGADQQNPDVYIYIANYLQPVGTTMSIFRRQFFFVMLMIMILTLFVSVVFAYNISDPIIRIKNSAKELPQGKFNADLADTDFDEIKQLASTLESASHEIAKSEDLRRELTANISHDLRTPLTMIKAYAEMIRDLSGDNPEKRERHLKIIIDETDRLSSLVNDILDLSKLQAGVSEISAELFDFSVRLKGVISRFDILKENDGIIIDLQAENDIIINADITKLEQVVYNLINNAVTYTGDDNTVIVRLYHKDASTIRFEVTDHGEGISPEFLPYIWDRYYKVSERNKTHKRAKMGSGIGLSIVKSVLELHDFAYGADSVVGEGSTFWFEAPVPAMTEPEPQKSTTRLLKTKAPKE